MINLYRKFEEENQILHFIKYQFQELLQLLANHESKITMNQFDHIEYILAGGTDQNEEVTKNSSNLNNN